jgi:hypothetical protein
MHVSDAVRAEPEHRPQRKPFDAGKTWVTAPSRRSPWRDETSRRETFTLAHPEVRITPGTEYQWWQAVIPAQDGGEVLTGFDLGDLLDELEARYGVAFPAGPGTRWPHSPTFPLPPVSAGS